VKQDGYTLTSKIPKPYRTSWCPGFTVYHLTLNGKERLFYHVRLNRRQSCTLDVSYGYQSSDLGYNRRVEDEFMPWVEAVARLAVAGSGVVPVIPADAVTRLRSYDEERLFCAGKPGVPDSVTSPKPGLSRS